jgi:hypothetical protein
VFHQCGLALSSISITLLLLYFQSVGLPKLSSTDIRNQDVHSNGPVLDDVVLADPEVCFISISQFWINAFSCRGVLGGELCFLCGSVLVCPHIFAGKH